MSIEIGMTGHAETVVTPQNTADAVGSGLVPVFATPFMVALMENAASSALVPHLEGGQGSVGTKLSVTHDSATPIGLKVWADAEVTAVNGKQVIFKVTAYDEKGPVGSGTHERFIISVERFLEKTARKAEGQ